MKYQIKITLKNGILDNAGKAVTRALTGLGFTGINDVRIGKIYELKCGEKDIENIAKNLTNEVMENYEYETH